MPKGDALAVARLAGIQGAKRTPDLVPLAHPIALHGVTVDLDVTDDGVAITAVVRTADRTGVEMEALTCVAVAGLALIDMVKAVDPGAVITDVRVEEKTGGRPVDWRAGAGRRGRPDPRARRHRLEPGGGGGVRGPQRTAAGDGLRALGAEVDGPRRACRTATRSKPRCGRRSPATTTSS